MRKVVIVLFLLLAWSSAVLARCFAGEDNIGRRCRHPGRGRRYDDLCEDEDNVVHERYGGRCSAGEVCENTRNRLIRCRSTGRPVYTDSDSSTSSSNSAPAPGSRTAGDADSADVIKPQKGRSWTGASGVGYTRTGPGGADDWPMDDALDDAADMDPSKHSVAYSDRHFACLQALHTHWAALTSGHHKRSLPDEASTIGVGRRHTSSAAVAVSLIKRKPPVDSVCNPVTEQWLGRYCYADGRQYYDSCQPSYARAGVPKHAGRCSDGLVCEEKTDSERDDHIVCVASTNSRAGPSSPKTWLSSSSGSGGEKYVKECLDWSDDEATSRLERLSIHYSP